MLKAEVYHNPQLELDGKVRKLRQANFKRQFKLRAKVGGERQKLLKV